MLLTFDLETTNLDYGSALNPSNRIVMVSWSCDDGPVESFYGDIIDATRFWTAIELATHACAYNCKFEMLWLKRLGFNVDSLKWHDPMLGEKVVIGNTSGGKGYMSLGGVCGRYGFQTKDPIVDAMMTSGICPSEMPRQRLIDRCERDVKTTYSLHCALLSKIQANEQVHLYRNRCDFAVVLAHIESAGMLLDRERVLGHHSSYAEDVGQLQRAVDEFTGGINMKSPKQKAEFVYDTLKLKEIKLKSGKPKRTRAGGRMTDKNTMAYLSSQAKTDNQRAFFSLSIALSKASSALSKNLEFFKGVVEERDGWFKAQFNQTVAATHRLTSSGIPIQFKSYPKPKSVQFQNMPREFKGCFKAPRGYKIVEVDAMQLEFRVAAFLGQDKQALADIADPDFDAHIFSASKINNVDYDRLLASYRRGDKGAKTLRQHAKPHTFKPLYGGTKGTPGEEAYYREFSRRYAGLASVQENWLATVQRTGRLTTDWGMRFKWDTYTASNGVTYDKRTHKPVGPQVFNYPVQNLATAEIVPIAIVALYNRCKAENIDVEFVNTVHDSIICYVGDNTETLARFTKAAEWAFTTAVYEHLELLYDMNFNVPLGCEMNVGDHWSEGTDYKYDDVINQRKSA